MKGTHGGKRAGAGRQYSPEYRAHLAGRYASLLIEFIREGRRSPGKQALNVLHAERGGALGTTKRLIVKGGCDEIFLGELHDKQVRGEPLTAFD